MQVNSSPSLFDLLIQQLHPTKNPHLNLDTLRPTHRIAYWWLCPQCNHEWEAQINSRWRGKNKPFKGCPVCSNTDKTRYPKTGESLADRYPAIAQEWASTNAKPATELFPNSTLKGRWECSTCHHEWVATPNYRMLHKDCPQCYQSTKQIPESLQKWTQIDLSKVAKSSTEKIQWACPECQFTWEQSIKTFVNNPYCHNPIPQSTCQLSKSSPRKPFTQKQLDVLTQEWSEKNENPLSAFTAGSGVKGLWICSTCHHEWMTSIGARTSGSGCPACAIANQPRKVNQSLLEYAPLLAQEWSPHNDLMPKEVSYGSGYHASWVCSVCTYKWKAKVSDRTGQGKGCPKCAKKISKPEEGLDAFFQSKNLTFTRNARNVIAPFELDFYFSELKVAIEYNRLIWHSEKYKPDHYYHYNKWKACADKGIQLIMVWEDDWLRKPELVKTMLAHKLRVSDQPRIFARNLLLDKRVERDEGLQFMERNHIQGNVGGSLRIGLRDETGLLLALGVFKKLDEGWSLERYATSAQVIGGLGKILKQVSTPIITFADRTVSNGNLYTQLGFIPVKELPPDYSYLHQNQRMHKFNFRIRRFKNNPLLTFQEGMSEQELAALNNLYRIWDCGKIKYVRN